MQATQVQPLVQEDPQPAEQLSPRSAITEAHAPWGPSSATREGATVRSPGLQLEKARVQQRRPNVAKNK